MKKNLYTGVLYDEQKNTVALNKFTFFHLLYYIFFRHLINIPYSRNAKRDHKERCTMNDFGVIKFLFSPFFCDT